MKVFGSVVSGLVILLLLLITFGAGVVVGTTGIACTLLRLTTGVCEPETVRGSEFYLESIQALAELTTVRQNFSGVVTSEVEMPDWMQFLFGQRQVLVVGGDIEAGINLGAIRSTDVFVYEDSIAIQLPAPTLQSCALNEQQTYIADIDTGLFAEPAGNIDPDARRYAIAQFRDGALEAGILEQAQEEARAVISQFLLTSNPDLERVDVTFAPANPTAPLPANCG
jgi:hypothetical protein